MQTMTRAAYTKTIIPAEIRESMASHYRAVCEESRAVAAAVRGYINTAFSQRKSLVLYGPPGTAKTLLAAGIFNELGSRLDDRRKFEDFAAAGTADNIAWIRGDQLPGKWSHKPDDADPRSGAEWTYHLSTAHLVVIDDMDKCPVQDNWGAQLFGLIDTRLCDKRLPTIITMNHSPAGFIKRFGEANGEPIISRIQRTGGLFIRVPKVNLGGR